MTLILSLVIVSSQVLWRAPARTACVRRDTTSAAVMGFLLRRSSAQLRCSQTTRHNASTSMYSLTFCVRVMLPERHQLKPAVQDIGVMLRTPPSPASHRPAAPFALCRYCNGNASIAARCKNRKTAESSPLTMHSRARAIARPCTARSTQQNDTIACRPG